MTDNKSSTAPTIVGIDIGSLTTKVTLGSSCDYELVRSAHGGHTSPTAITIPQGKHRRLIGEDASEISRADGNTIRKIVMHQMRIPFHHSEDTKYLHLMIIKRSIYQILKRNIQLQHWLQCYWEISSEM